MAKKTKRSKATTSRLSEKQRYRPGERSLKGVVAPADSPAEVVTPSRPAVMKSAVSSRSPSEQELTEEYRYVLTDLKKIAWLALAMLALLVVLALVVV